MPVRMELRRILIREVQERHVVELREVDGQRELPIEIALNEAAAIERRLLGQVPPRPQTHELLTSVIESLGAKIERVEITEFKDRVFYARLWLRRDGELIDIDARPSDALALSVASGAPIYVQEKVLEEVDDLG